MKPAPETQTETTAETTRDFLLQGACLLCGGDLQVRIGPGTASTFCATCHWISHPHMKRGDEGSIHVIHPAGLLA